MFLVYYQEATGVLYFWEHKLDFSFLEGDSQGSKTSVDSKRVQSNLNLSL